jgi:hypothetical protein
LREEAGALGYLGVGFFNYVLRDGDEVLLFFESFGLVETRAHEIEILPEFFKGHWDPLGGLERIGQGRRIEGRMTTCVTRRIPSFLFKRNRYVECGKTDSGLTATGISPLQYTVFP